MKKLKMHPSSYMMWEDRSPFLYLADTAWSMPYRLTREEMETYFTVRESQGFNAVQVTALTEDDGLRTPNRYGCLPLEKCGGRYDPSRPIEKKTEDDCWKLLDDLLDLAA